MAALDIQSDGVDYTTGGGYYTKRIQIKANMWTTNNSTCYYDEDATSTASTAVVNKIWKAYATTCSSNSSYEDGSVIWPTTTWRGTNAVSTTTYSSLWAHGHEGNYGCWGDDKWIKAQFTPPTLSERLSDVIRSRHAPAIHIRPNDRRKTLAPAADIREQRARETMRRVLGDREYQRFIKCGFVSITGKSTLVYQIFPGHGITNVFKQGKMVDRLCVVLIGDFAPTDSLMMRYLMILNNEDEFRKHAVVHQVFKPQTTQISVPEQPKETLVEIFKKLKQVA